MRNSCYNAKGEVERRGSKEQRIKEEGRIKECKNERNKQRKED